MYKEAWGRMVAGAALASILMVAADMPAQALPMFARRFDGASCTKCHWQQNALNATGKAYLRHGVRDVDETADIREADFKASHYVSLGREASSA